MHLHNGIRFEQFVWEEAGLDNTSMVTQHTLDKDLVAIVHVVRGHHLNNE